MSSVPSRTKVVAVGAVCALAGAGAGTVAVAGASTGHSAAQSKSRTAHARHMKGQHRHGLMRLARREVHGQFVVHTRDGFKTVTVDRGTVDSVSGDTLTMTDSTPKASYQQQTITIPSTARVRNDRQKASLSSLTAGERVVVVQLPKRTVVVAHPAHAHTS